MRAARQVLLETSYHLDPAVLPHVQLQMQVGRRRAPQQRGQRALLHRFVHERAPDGRGMVHQDVTPRAADMSHRHAVVQRERLDHRAQELGRQTHDQSALVLPGGEGGERAVDDVQNLVRNVVQAKLWVWKPGVSSARNGSLRVPLLCFGADDGERVVARSCDCGREGLDGGL